MNRILLVRHGSTDHNRAGLMRGWTDDPLSALGRRQAALTAAALMSQKPPAAGVFCSTLPRAVETAQILAQALALPVLPRDDLRELNLGDMEGQTEQALWDYYLRQAAPEPGHAGTRDVVFPGGESIAGFMHRTRAALADIGARHAGAVLVVSHGVQTMLALGLWLEPDVTRWPAYRVDNCSLTEVAFEPAPRLVRLNDTRHLRGADQPAAGHAADTGLASG
jgi:broad specificity phosphatase PhoE